MAARRHAERGPPPRVKSCDPAIAGDAHQAIGGKQQPGLGQADAEIGVIERQQQIEQRVPGLCQGESKRGISGIAVRASRLPRRANLPPRRAHAVTNLA